MMRTRSILELLLVIFVLGACTPARPLSATETVQTLPVNNTSLPTPLLTTTSLAANWESAKNCVTEYPKQPEESQLEGVAVLQSLSSTVIGRELSLLNLKDGTSRNIDTANQPVEDVAVSPDRHSLAYSWFNNTTEKWELVLIDSAGELQQVAWSSKSGFFFQDWLNDHQLVIRQDVKYLIVDPYQDSQVSISPSDFPEYNLYDLKAFLSFDPLLSRAIYKSSTEINVLDLNSKAVRAPLKDGYDRVLIVSWLSSGEKAAVIATLSPEQKLDNFSLPDEIFIVEKDGQVRQLTHLFDAFGLPLTIDSLSWSPDGSQIAFWLHDTEANPTLMVADYESGNTVDYCVTNVWRTAFPVRVSQPIWSPDGKYLMVENRYASDKNRVLVVDLSNKSAFPIAENASPDGWMVEKP
jgi:Tol biopolymer transport system component